MPSQTALSGANPISRRIAGRSGGKGVRARREDGGLAAARGLRCPPPRSPLLPSAARQSEAGKCWAKLHLGNRSPRSSSARAGGLREPRCPARPGRGGGHVCSPRGKSGEAEAPQDWRGGPPAFPRVPQARVSSRTHARHQGGRGPERLPSQNRALPYRGDEVTVIPLHPADRRALKRLRRPISGGLIFCCTPQAGS